MKNKTLNIPSLRMFMIIFTFLMCGLSIKGNSQVSDVTVPAANNSDADIIAMIIAVNLNEINAAELAQKKNLSSAVMDYANMLHTAHSDNMTEANILAKNLELVPAETKDAENLKTKGAEELLTLSPLDGTEFEGPFIAAMIKGHTDVLEMIDTILLPQATNEYLKTFLKETRGDIAMHLEAAQKLQTTNQ